MNHSSSLYPGPGIVAILYQGGLVILILILEGFSNPHRDNGQKVDRNQSLANPCIVQGEWHEKGITS
eukprot:3708651-Rhodomonas_salina.4